MQSLIGNTDGQRVLVKQGSIASFCAGNLGYAFCFGNVRAASHDSDGFPTDISDDVSMIRVVGGLPVGLKLPILEHPLIAMFAQSGIETLRYGRTIFRMDPLKPRRETRAGNWRLQSFCFRCSKGYAV